jgi:hypothetical protein
MQIRGREQPSAPDPVRPRLGCTHPSCTLSVYVLGVLLKRAKTDCGYTRRQQFSDTLGNVIPAFSSLFYQQSFLEFYEAVRIPIRAFSRGTTHPAETAPRTSCEV